MERAEESVEVLEGGAAAPAVAEVGRACRVAKGMVVAAMVVGVAVSSVEAGTETEEAVARRVEAETELQAAG